MARERLLAERPHAAAQVAEHILGAAGLDLDARRVASERARDLRLETVDVGREIVFGSEAAAGRAAQRGHHFRANVGGGQSDRQRSARAPEAYPVHREAPSQAASAAGDTAASASR